MRDLSPLYWPEDTAVLPAVAHEEVLPAVRTAADIPVEDIDSAVGIHTAGPVAGTLPVADIRIADPVADIAARAVHTAVMTVLRLPGAAFRVPVPVLPLPVFQASLRNIYIETLPDPPELRIADIHFLPLSIPPDNYSKRHK